MGSSSSHSTSNVSNTTTTSTTTFANAFNNALNTTQNFSNIGGLTIGNGGLGLTGAGTGTLGNFNYGIILVGIAALFGFFLLLKRKQQ